MPTTPTYEELRLRVQELEKTVEANKRKVRTRTLELEKEKKKYKDFIENLGDIAYETDCYGNLTFTNKKAVEMTGLPFEDIIGKPFLPLVSEECRETAMAAYRQTLNGDQSEFELTFFNGRIGHFINTPLKDENGHIIGVFGISRDITERKQMETQLLENKKLVSIGRLSAGVAHEINNPATFVNVNINTLEKWWKMFQPVLDRALALGWDKEMDLPKLTRMRTDVPEMIQAIQKGIKRISRITNALKEFARDEKSEREVVDIAKIIDDAILITENEFKYYAEIVVELDPNLPKIYGASLKLEQVFVNLIINAAYAIKEKIESRNSCRKDFKGLITITADMPGHHDGMLEITVKDNGTGIKDDIIGKIFDPFFSTKPVGSGTGLGMSIVYGIINDHDGRISVDSKVGGGTLFTIQLPVNLQAEQKS